MAHVGGDAGLLAGLVDGVDAVIAVSGELVGLGAISGSVSVNERLVGFIGGGERGHEHQTLSKGSVEAGHGQDAIHAVHAEESGSIAHGLSLGEDDGSGLIVDGEEDEVSTGILRTGQLDGEVGSGIVGESALIDDLESALIGGFLHEGVADALGVSVVVTVDDGDFGTSEVFSHVVGSANALVGVGEADLEDIVLARGDVGGGSGRGQHKGAVIVADIGNRDGSAGGGGADEDLHAVVHHGVVGVNGLFAVGLIVLREELKLDGAVARVDFIDGELHALLDGHTVDRVVAGQRAGGADRKGLDAVGCAASIVVGVRIVALGTAGGHRERHGRSHEHAHKLLFHRFKSPLIK